VAIDVDSKGRDCKERMMSVLMDEIVDTAAQRWCIRHVLTVWQYIWTSSVVRKL